MGGVLPTSKTKTDLKICQSHKISSLQEFASEAALKQIGLNRENGNMSGSNDRCIKADPLLLCTLKMC